MAAAMAMLNAKCLSIISNKNTIPTRPQAKPTSLLSLQYLPKGLTISKPSDNTVLAEQIAEIAEGDNRGLVLLLPIIAAMGWVLFNILQLALNQINRMRESKGVIIGVELGGLIASGFVSTPEASVSEIALLLFAITPAPLWVLYNILQPALNQFNIMRSE
ncbi:hypothetical protein K2173_005744 [Erythroxylum novogranatense]|uniref:Uncharacterized protein n=1 Tax=Erythroxylum novogranatense TaxID=1862640 RepID=A0AAV8U5C5_9ROSI|nr:hypothetical protein K2173_005744 [Erythroxylum novogranatense]